MEMILSKINRLAVVLQNGKKVVYKVDPEKGESLDWCIEFKFPLLNITKKTIIKKDILVWFGLRKKTITDKDEVTIAVYNSTCWDELIVEEEYYDKQT